MTTRLMGTHCTTAAAARAPVQFGFNVFTDPQTIAEQQSLGATVRRVIIPWWLVEPSPGKWDWGPYDVQYNELVAAGLKPEIMIFGAPCWARPSTKCDNSEFTGPPDPGYDADWTTFVQQAVIRYPKAIGFEIWNEPNLTVFWWPDANAVRYTQILKEAYTAVKSVDPQMPVVSGGLLSSPLTGSTPGGEGDVPFLTTMFAQGAKNFMDGIGVHPYPALYDATGATEWDANQMDVWLNRVRAVKDAAGAASMPLWITEVGVSTTTQAGAPAAVTPAQQAADLVTMVEDVKAASDVPVMIIHTLGQEASGLGLLLDGIDGLLGSSDTDEQENDGFGVFAPSGSPEPAACTLSQQFGGTLHCS